MGNLKKGTERQFYFHLIQSLQLVAAPYQSQIKVFPSFVNLPDEIALTFNDSYLLSEQLLKAGLISKVVYTELSEVDACFEALSNPENAGFWTLEAMQHDFRWQEFREKAIRILELLNQIADSPDLDNITFIPS